MVKPGRLLAREEGLYLSKMMKDVMSCGVLCSGWRVELFSQTSSKYFGGKADTTFCDILQIIIPRYRREK